MATNFHRIQEIEVAWGFWSRFRGWMGKKPLPQGTALLICPCSSIHTFFMREPIDVAFLDRSGRVLSVIEGLRPWRVSPWIRKAVAVLEMPAFGARISGIKEGEKLPSPLAELVSNLIESHSPTYMS